MGPSHIMSQTPPLHLRPSLSHLYLTQSTPQHTQKHPQSLHFTMPHTLTLQYLTQSPYNTSHPHPTILHTITLQYLTQSPYNTSHNHFTMLHTVTIQYLTQPPYNTSHNHPTIPHTITLQYLTQSPYNTSHNHSISSACALHSSQPKSTIFLTSCFEC